MRLRSKLLVGYGIILGLVVLVVAWAVINLVMLGQASNAILQENYRSINAAGQMIHALELQNSSTLTTLLDGEGGEISRFREQESRFLRWLARAQDNLTIEGEGRLLDEIESLYSRYLTQYTLLRERRFQTEADLTAFHEEQIVPLLQTIRTRIEELREMNQQTMLEASSRAKRLATRAVWSTMAVAAVAVVAGFGFSLILSRRVSNPIRQLLKAMEKLAEGNYDSAVETQGSDEIAGLAQGFNAMARKLGSYHEMNLERLTAERRRSDAVLQSIDEGVVVVDAEYRVLSINPKAAEILQVDPQKAMETHILELLPSEDIFTGIKETASSGEPAPAEEEENLLTIERGESVQYFEYSVTPVKSSADAVRGVVLLLRDVTRNKKMDQLKSEFLMTASHELKTPLQSLGMSIELLRESAQEKSDPEEVELIDAASDEISRLKSLVSDLLDLSKIESGRLELEVGSASVSKLVDNAISLLSRQAEESKIKLEAEQPEEEIQVQADPNKVTWVLTNLIGNALRYARERITVGARQRGRWGYISVSDDGKGIPVAYQSTIFEKFSQVPGKEATGGTGLGLAISREIVRAHGGTIWVESAEGEGSTFIFTLPLSGQKKEQA